MISCLGAPTATAGAPRQHQRDGPSVGDGSHFSVAYTQLHIHLVQYILSSQMLFIWPRVLPNQEEMFPAISSSIHCQRCYLVLVLFHLVMVGWIIRTHAQDVMVYLDGTTVEKQAKEIGRAHPLFAAAVIGNIIIMLTMSPPKK